MSNGKGNFGSEQIGVGRDDGGADDVVGFVGE